MISVYQTNHLHVIKPVITHNKLYKLSGYVGDPEKFKLNPTSKYLAIYHDHDLVGIAELRNLTAITADAHIYMLPEAQKRKLSVPCGRAVIDFINKNTKLEKLLVTVPFQCVHALKYVLKLGFTVCGQIKNGIIYKNNKQDLILFEREV